jgi:hypothetical protein
MKLEPKFKLGLLLYGKFLVHYVHNILLRLEASFIYDQVEAMVKISRRIAMTLFCHNFL